MARRSPTNLRMSSTQGAVEGDEGLIEQQQARIDGEGTRQRWDEKTMNLRGNSREGGTMAAKPACKCR